MKITVIGTGYVGLVTGACLAEMGNHVRCVDVDAEKIKSLQQGVMPIYEPGLEEIVRRCAAQSLLSFTTELEQAIQECAVLFIAVGTPPGEDGSADLSAVLAVAQEIAQHLNDYAVVVNKSTVPVGTAEQVKATMQAVLRQRQLEINFDVVSNPEFLKEGAAVGDFMRPDRVLVGTDSDRARAIMEELYEPFSRTRDKLLVMGIRDAEMTKYAANAMLATKISFMNEIANLCEKMQVDVEQVRHGIGSDKRIGYSFIYPGCGFGGSCFPKDIRALIHMAQQHEVDPVLLEAVQARNDSQKQHLFTRMQVHFNDDFKGKTFAIWGLAFKPGTDDVREASSLVLIDQLLQAGASVKAYDPVANEAAQAIVAPEWIDSGRLQFCEHQYEAIPGADALVLVTEWKFFRQPDFEFLKQQLNHRVIFDGRNQYDPQRLQEKGFTYYGIGR